MQEISYVVHFNDPDVYSKERGLNVGRKKDSKGKSKFQILVRNWMLMLLFYVKNYYAGRWRMKMCGIQILQLY